MDQEVDYQNLIRFSVMQYKLSLGIRHSLTEGNSSLTYPELWAWGKHTFSKEELKLDAKDQKDAAMFLAHSTLLTIAVQVDSALERRAPNRFASVNSDLKNLAIIARMIRNSFAHNPFFPVWLIQEQWQDQVFEVSNVISMDTTGLHGKPVDRHDYGGPLAILSLAEKALDFCSANSD